MKTFLFTTAVILLFTACKEHKDRISTTPAAEGLFAPAHDITTARVNSDIMGQAVQVGNNGLVAITDWSTYPTIATQVTLLDKISKSELTAALTILREHFNSFKNSIPAYLMIDNVQDAIEDVEKELITLEWQLPKKEVAEKERAAQIKKLQESFFYLENKIVQTRSMYAGNAALAAAAYLKELNDYNINKSTAHDIRAAAQKVK